MLVKSSDRCYGDADGNWIGGIDSEGGGVSDYIGDIDRIIGDIDDIIGDINDIIGDIDDIIDVIGDIGDIGDIVGERGDVIWGDVILWLERLFPGWVRLQHPPPKSALPPDIWLNNHIYTYAYKNLLYLHLALPLYLV